MFVSKTSWICALDVDRMGIADPVAALLIRIVGFPCSRRIFWAVEIISWGFVMLVL